MCLPVNSGEPNKLGKVLVVEVLESVEAVEVESPEEDEENEGGGATFYLFRFYNI